MKILVTGSAGFIGYHLSKRLLSDGHTVIGVDNLNNYYDPKLKQKRVDLLPEIIFYRGDITELTRLKIITIKHKPDIIIHLAAQAGVRHSIDSPFDYVQNITGFLNVIECCREYNIKKLIYASSSSVYGNQQTPFSEFSHPAPESFYAATKIFNEMTAACFEKFYGIETIGLRFFTIYGELGRPDMAYWKFTESILKGKPIQLYNNGDLQRDFTHVSDIVEGICKILNSENRKLKPVYNIGSNNPVSLAEFVKTIESALEKTAIIEYLPMQPGDVLSTYADIDLMKQDFGYTPQMNLAEGIKGFTDWYLSEL